MKKKFIIAITAIISIGFQRVNAQVNTTLSNLTSPTAINQNLIPNRNNIRNLGTSAKSWRVLYLDSAIYLKDSLFMHTAGLYNTFVGFQAGKSLTTGVQNAAFGYDALYSNTLGEENTALGKAVLFKNTNGSFNTGSGYQALFNNTGGNNNTASGAYSLFINNTGSYNTAVGFSALRVNSSGGLNSAFGESALYNNTIGGYNTASGETSLYTNSDGSYNTASGWQSLYSNISGNQNTATGAVSLYYNTGSFNVGNGYKAGRSNTNGSNNVFIGWQAGYNNTDGSNNVYLGYNAGGVDHLSNTVAIGAGVSATQSNTIILGTNQNVGIGTTNPQYKLSVNGTIQAKELRVETGWSDYVFEKDYKLLSLKNVAIYIEQNKHLPGIPSAKEIQDNGLALGEVQTKMMAKIEELTLYLIQQNLQIQQLQEKVKQMEKR